EARSAHLLHRTNDDLSERAWPPSTLPVLEFLVSLLDDYNGRVDHRADGDGDAPEGHDVCCDPQCSHRNEGENDRDGNRENGDDCARDVPEKDEDDEAHDEHLFPERMREGLDGTVDQRRAVIGHDDLDARWE